MPLIVNGETVDDAVIRAEARQLRPRYRQAVQEMDPIEAEMQLREWSRENVIERTLLRQEAAKNPAGIPDESIERTMREWTNQSGGESACRTGVSDVALRETVESQLRVERLLAGVTAKVKPPRTKDLTEYYRKNQKKFWRPELISARHIVKHVDENCDEETARSAIEAIDRRLGAGEKFEQLADEVSDCPGRGGDLGYFPRGEMVPEFDEVVFTMEPRQTSGIFRTTFGFHMVRLEDRKAAGVPPFPEVREQAEAHLRREKRDRAIEQYLDRLRAKADVKIIREPKQTGDGQ